MIDKDIEKATSMLPDRIIVTGAIVTGAQGASTMDVISFAKMMSEGNWELCKFSLDDVHVEFPHPDVAVIAYKVREELKIDGKPMSLEAADASTWIKKESEWRCALHTESVLGDPFGCDKAGAAGN
ncbi:MAG TPA: hypothetical protein VFG71_12400 [Nitrospiraceae bacterium]|nr:hypothetical protein [Nitrospiraceae bacterium]